MSRAPISWPGRVGGGGALGGGGRVALERWSQPPASQPASTRARWVRAALCAVGGGVRAQPDAPHGAHWRGHPARGRPRWSRAPAAQRGGTPSSPHPGACALRAPSHPPPCCLRAPDAAALLPTGTHPTFISSPTAPPCQQAAGLGAFPDRRGAPRAAVTLLATGSRLRSPPPLLPFFFFFFSCLAAGPRASTDTSGSRGGKSPLSRSGHRWPAALAVFSCSRLLPGSDWPPGHPAGCGARVTRVACFAARGCAWWSVSRHVPVRVVVDSFSPVFRPPGPPFFFPRERDAEPLALTHRAGLPHLLLFAFPSSPPPSSFPSSPTPPPSG